MGTLLQHLILKVLATRPRVAYAAKFRAMNMKHRNKAKILNCSCEGGEKTILQSNNMVALRVIYFHLDASTLWYGTIDITQ